MTKSVGFISTGDTTGGTIPFRTNDVGTHIWRRDFGGSPGSVVVNRELEVVGMVVDRNIESLQNDFVFSGAAARTVSMHVDGIMEALVKIYDAHHVARELNSE